MSVKSLVHICVNLPYVYNLPCMCKFALFTIYVTLLIYIRILKLDLTSSLEVHGMDNCLRCPSGNQMFSTLLGSETDKLSSAVERCVGPYNIPQGSPSNIEGAWQPHYLFSNYYIEGAWQPHYLFSNYYIEGAWQPHYLFSNYYIEGAWQPHYLFSNYYIEGAWQPHYLFSNYYIEGAWQPHYLFSNYYIEGAWQPHYLFSNYYIEGANRTTCSPIII